MKSVIFFSVFFAAFAIAAFFVGRQIFEDWNAALDIAYRRELELQSRGKTPSRWQRILWILCEFVASLARCGKVYLRDDTKKRPVFFTIDL